MQFGGMPTQFEQSQGLEVSRNSHPTHNIISTYYLDVHNILFINFGLTVFLGDTAKLRHDTK